MKSEGFIILKTAFLGCCFNRLTTTISYNDKMFESIQKAITTFLVMDFSNGDFLEMEFCNSILFISRNIDNA